MNERPDETLPLSRLRQIDKVCDQFEAALKAGEKVSPVDYLDRVGKAERPNLRKELEAIQAEFLRPPKQKQEKVDQSRPDPGVAKFTAALIESRLMTDEEVRRFEDSLPEDERPETAQQYAKLLFRHKKLTKFQAQAVYQGKTRGLVVGNYVLLDRIGAGGMGQVYKARHRRMDRIVALKVLPSSATKSPESIARFQQEVKAAARLDHPNVVTAYDADEDDGVHFLVMELVEGGDLSALVKARGPLPVRQAVELMIQAARGLEYSHGKNIVHRDIKPANLLLDTSGTVKVLDMGLARFDPQPGGGDTTADRELTRSGQVMGTLDYMSPEQAVDTHRAGPPADIYSLGCTLFYLLLGRSVYGGNTLTKKILSHREKPIPSLMKLREDVPASLDRVFRKMLAKAPQDRQASMTEVIAELEASLDETPQEMTVAPAPAPAVSGPTRANIPGVSPGPEAANLPLAVAAPPRLALDTDSEMIETSPENWLEGPIPSIVTNIPKPVRHRLPSWLADKKKNVVVGVSIAAATAGLLLLYGIIVSLQTPRGTLVAEINDPAVEAIVRDGALTIKDLESDRVYTVEPGETRLPTGQYDVIVRDDAGLQVSTPKFTLRRDGKVTVEVSLEAVPQTAIPESPATFYNGQGNPAMASRPGATPVVAPGASSARPNLPPTVWPDDAPPTAVAPFDETQATQHQQAWADYLDEPVETTNSIGMKLKLIPPGEFLMGSPEDEVDRDDDETQHLVRITEPYYLGVMEVTQGQWEEVMGSRPWERNAGVKSGPDHAVSYVTWEKSVEFCRKLSATDGRTYRLPTEAQWEYACRAGSAAAFCFGADATNLGSYAWYRENSQPIREYYPRPVGSKRANAWGLHDMHGNVWERCQDWYGSYDVSLRTDNPTGPTTGLKRMHRGGSWASYPKNCRSASRSEAKAPPRSPALGFRVVAVLVESSPEPAAAVAPTVWPDDAPATAVAPFDETQATQYQQAWADYLEVPVETTNSIGMKLKLIPPGEFLMGSPEDEVDRDDDETQHRVRITEPYYLGVTEVTQGQWEAVMGSRPWERNPEAKSGPEYPVSYVSNDDAVEFCRKLSATDGRTYGLPTEAQWEYACRAGSTAAFYFGAYDESDLDSYAWSRNNARDGDEDYAHGVGLKRANAWGLYDMHGNVWELCQDWYVSYDVGLQTDNPAWPTTDLNHICRGGNWSTAVRNCRSARRHSLWGSNAQPGNGFRVVAVLVESSPEPDAAAAPTVWPDDAPPMAVAPFDETQATRHQQAWADYLDVSVETTNSIGMKLKLIPPGEFLMGSPEDEVGRDEDETQHRVRITEPYYLGVTEVTQGQWEAVMGTRPWEGKERVKSGPEYPVSHVDWEDSVEFLQELSAKDGRTYRLPTEAQWEYACRAGSAAAYCCGADRSDLRSYAWCGVRTTPSDEDYAHEVGLNRANAWGLYDMHGNLWEWCQDWYGSYDVSLRTDDPTGPTTGFQHTRRGGDWTRPGHKLARSASRHSPRAPSASPGIGFRVVAVLVESSPEPAAAAAPTVWPDDAPPPTVAPLDETEHEGRPLTVDEARPRENLRGGGGGGGFGGGRGGGGGFGGGRGVGGGRGFGAGGGVGTFPGDGRMSIKFSGVSRLFVLKQVLRRYDLSFDDPSTRALLSRPTKIEVQHSTREDIVRAILDPVHLTYRVEEMTVYISRAEDDAAGP